MNTNVVDANGIPRRITPAEVVLNWQTQNVCAQNQQLKKIEEKVDDVAR